MRIVPNAGRPYATVTEMKRVGERLAGKPYDLTFGWADDRMYCSELVYKIYDRGADIELGRLATIADFDLTHPAVEQKLRQRFGETVPLGETVISPQSIFDDPKLRTVFEGRLTSSGRWLPSNRNPD